MWLAADGYGTVNLQDLIDHAAVLRAGLAMRPGGVKGAFDLSRPTMWLLEMKLKGLVLRRNLRLRCALQFQCTALLNR